MDQFYLVLELFLVLNILFGLIRVLRSAVTADRMLAIQLFGTTGVAILLIMAQRLDSLVLRNVALVLSLLATLAMVAFVRLVGTRGDETAGSADDAKDSAP